MAENSEGFSEKLQLGDSVFVSEYEWREGYRVLTRNEGEVTPNRKNWYVGRINFQALVTQIEYISYASRKDFPGVVIKIRRGGKFNSLLYCTVISPRLQVSSRCYRCQLLNLDLDELEIGQLVAVSVAFIPEHCLIGESYILPPQTEFKIGSEEVIEDGMGVLGTVGIHGPWPYRRNGKNVFYPLIPEMYYAEV